MKNPDVRSPDGVRPWYKKKRYIGLIALAVIGGVSAVGSSTPAPVAEPQVLVPTSQSAAVDTASRQVDLDTSSEQLSNDNHYTNINGNTVHSPAYAPTGCAAAGASAECRDGTCSFSQHRQGTCSHHGGVAKWL